MAAPVFVDGDDVASFTYSSDVLSCSTNTEGEVELGSYGASCKANLGLFRKPAIVCHVPRRADRSGTCLMQTMIFIGPMLACSVSNLVSLLIIDYPMLYVLLDQQYHLACGFAFSDGPVSLNCLVKRKRLTNNDFQLAA